MHSYEDFGIPLYLPNNQVKLRAMKTAAGAVIVIGINKYINLYFNT